MPNIDELSHDMTFTIGGETFVIHDVSPDVLMTTEAEESQDGGEGEGEGEEGAREGKSSMERIDEQILLFLNGDDGAVARWKALRARKQGDTPGPVPLWKILEFRRLLWETQSDRPTTPPSTSVAGRGKSAPTSTVA